MAKQEYTEKLSSKGVESPKVFFRGVYRIVGQVVKNVTDSKPVGFLIMNEKTGNVKAFNIAQTLVLIRKFKFVNAEESKKEPNTIRCTEGKMDNIMKFNSQLQCVSEPKIMILGEVVRDNLTDEREFKVLGPDLKVMPTLYKESELISMVNMPPFSGISAITNAKNSSGTTIVANTSHGVERDEEDTGFPKILKEDVPKVIQEKKRKSEWRKEKHRQKLVDKAAWHLFKSICNGDWGFGGNSTFTLEPKKEIKILINEIYPKYIESPEKLQEIQEKARLILKDLDVKSNTNVKSKKEVFVCILGVYQYMLEIPEVEQKFIKYCQDFKKKKRYKQRNFSEFDFSYRCSMGCCYDRLLEKNYAYPKFKNLVEKLSEKVSEKKSFESEESKESKESEKDIAYRRLHVVENCHFKNAKEIAELGFAVHKKYAGKEYISSNGRKYKLKYIGDLIPNYSEYLKMATCFGDIACLAQVEGALKLYSSWNKTAWRCVPEILLGILSIYNPKMAKKYIDERLSKISEFSNILPNVDFDSLVDYNLNPKLQIYFESGFNAFYLTKEILDDYPSLQEKYKIVKKYKRYAGELGEPIVNYRSLFHVSYKIKHSLLTELSTIVGLLTSDECTPEIIDAYIGNLKYI